MLYSIPYEYIGKKVDVRITGTVIEVFYNQNRIASHRRLYGRKNQYSTVTEHMPKDHQHYLEWNGGRFRNWAERIGENTAKVIDAVLRSKRVEQQSYRACMGLLKLADKIPRQSWRKPAKQPFHTPQVPAIRASATCWRHQKQKALIQQAALSITITTPTALQEVPDTIGGRNHDQSGNY